MTILPFCTDSEIIEAIPAAIDHLQHDRVLAYPTETVYGFGSSTSPRATALVADLKVRSPEHPLLVLISHPMMLSRMDVSLQGAAYALAQKFWPGPLTLILPPNGIGVRWTSHAGMTRLIDHFGQPLTSTSANRTGLPPMRSADEIASEWSDDLANGTLLVLDGGQLPVRPPSTLVDCTSSIPRLLREGAITVTELRATVPEVTAGE